MLYNHKLRERSSEGRKRRDLRIFVPPMEIVDSFGGVYAPFPPPSFSPLVSSLGMNFWTKRGRGGGGRGGGKEAGEEDLKEEEIETPINISKS